MSTLIRPLVPTMEFGLRTVIGRIPNSIGLLIAALFFSVAVSGQADSTISCYGRVNMSITKSGITTVSPVHVTGRRDLTNLKVEMPDRGTPRLRCSDIGEVIKFTLTDTIIGISCWGELYIEDKLPYDIVCNDGTVPCETALSAIDPADFIKVDDNCLTLSDLTVTYTDDIGKDFPASSDTLRLITRLWSTTDLDGLVRNCTSKIYVLPLDLNTIELPKDTTITCDQNPLDTAVTGGLNISPELLKENCCVGFALPSITGPLLFECGTKMKYVRTWEVFDWCKGTMRSEMQTIIVQADKDKTRLVAPTTFARVAQGCMPGVVLGAPTVETDCADFTLENTEVFITTANTIITTKLVGDTVYLAPGNYNFIYRPNNTCPATIDSDTALVNVSNLINPTLVCSDSLNKIISIGSADSLLINLNLVYRNANIMACGDFDVLGRKIDTAGVATTSFDSLMTLYLAEAPAKLRIELMVVSADGLSSDTCTAWIDVQEKVPPSLTLHRDINSPIVDMNGMLVIDTSVIIASLGDNSGCISNISITGSGSVMSGSGMMMTGSLTWFTDGEFQEFQCADIGTYKVKVVVNDCDNNMTMDTTTLTISNGGGCPMMANVSGRVIAYGRQPIGGVDVSLLSANNIYIANSQLDGSYFMSDVASAQEYELEIGLADLWQNGLTAHDLSLMKHYILGIEHFDMYQRAGADVDNNGEINLSDFLAVQKILLGKDVDITSTSVPWIFSNKVEEGRLVPFEGGSISINGPRRLDWQAVKRGDIDGDALTSAEGRSLVHINATLLSENKDGYIYSINFGSNAEIRAFQGAIDLSGYNVEVLSQHEEIETNMVQGYLTTLFYDRIPNSNNNQSLDIILKSQKRFSALALDDTKMASYIWTHSGVRSKMHLQLESSSEDDSNVASAFNLSAFPNPTSAGAVLELSNDVNRLMPVTITISDVLGRVYSAESHVLSPLVSNQQLPIDLPTKSGIYVVSVQSIDNQGFIRLVKK